MYEEFFAKENIFLVVGAANNEEKYGYKVFADLKTAEYNVVAINSRIGGQEEIQETPSYKSIHAFFEKITQLFNESQIKTAREKAVVVLVIPPENILGVLEQAKKEHIHKVWFQPGSESKEAKDFCEKNNITIVQDTCIVVTRPK